MGKHPADVRYAEFDAALRERLWSWADRHHTNELDGGGRNGRPPVLRAEFASKALLVPTGSASARSILSSLPIRDRHPYFGSFKSSQSLAQSVFGAVAAYDRLDLLDGIIADCGRSAFLENNIGANLTLEHQVQTLGEPRRTSVDVLLEAPTRRVAVECKFTERNFGVCSRPKLRPDTPTYAQQHCDGNYRVQRHRQNRCALTEIGVRYWTFLPDLFEWNADQDMIPCPLSPVYQLARNVLAATVTDAGFDPNSGHALVVYDTRNPEFANGGAARNQYDMIMASCRIPGLVRGVSWQRIAGSLTAAPELKYLVAGLNKKYGISPL